MPVQGVRQSWFRRAAALLRRASGEPLLQFVVLGSLAFAAGQWLDARRVVIPDWRVEEAQEQMAAFLATPALTAEQRLEADVRVLGDELLYREALRRGLDRDDLVIRRHLAQKLLLLTEELELAGRVPDVAGLQALYREMTPRWSEPARISFCHAYSRTPWPAGAAAGQPAPADSCPRGAGEAFALGTEIHRWSEAEIAAQFGPAFAQALAAAPAGTWVGPLASRFGSHLVWIREHVAARTPTFEEKRTTLVALWSQRVRQHARQELLRQLAGTYRAGSQPGDPATTEGRLALAAATLAQQDPP